ncbi:MAG TPA: HEAT repeat domain-containing protein, partial [Polyangiaceae bacterium LLY-WYZ-15_(1-7)]|nr:HEAT repeat domain-containing protein [Polyangiaceae bacterium LLY-WYZ-15_(1-7)]
MSDPVERRRRRVRELAGARLDDERRDALLEGLADPDWRVRAEAVQSVIRCAPEERDPLLPRLVDALAQGENVGLRNAALEALGRLGR